MIELLLSDTFWIGFAVGYVVSMVIGVIIELLCIASGRSSIDVWMEDTDCKK
jgi:ABC-type uncharacterized transport system permease subunit